MRAFTDSGFLYLSSLPTPTAGDLARAYEQSRRFFARPQSEKDALAWTTARANRGYTGHGREKVSQGSAEEVAAERAASGQDLKESLEIGREGDPGYPNRWPGEEQGAGAKDEETEEFKTFMQDFFLQCKEIHRLLMGAIALGLDLDEHHFDDFCEIGDNTLRLLHYPAVEKAVFERNRGQVRAGAHSDYGSITLLFQDNRGGLQVETEDGTWRNVTPIEGTVVVNAGDLLARWTNDRIKSTKHRVVEPPVPAENGTTHPARYSIAYFCNPDFHKEIDSVPGTFTTAQDKKYPSVNSGEYLEMRLTATY